LQHALEAAKQINHPQTLKARIAMTTAANPIVAWKTDPAHSRAEFKVKHMMISNVKSSFNDLTGT
jgi:polyisoprenoid-binding protein YceI